MMSSKQGMLGNPWGEIGRSAATANSLMMKQQPSERSQDWTFSSRQMLSKDSHHETHLIHPNTTNGSGMMMGVLGESAIMMQSSQQQSLLHQGDNFTQGLNVVVENGGLSNVGSGNRNPRYKTEMCRNFKERSRCIYGDQCQFAHGRTDLRDVVRNTKYKTKLCQKYWAVGYCAYGPRCNFLHDEAVARQMASSTSSSQFMSNNEYLKTKSTGSISPTPSSSSDSLNNDRNYDLVIPSVMDQPDEVFISQWPSKP